MWKQRYGTLQTASEQGARGSRPDLDLDPSHRKSVLALGIVSTTSLQQAPPGWIACYAQTPQLKAWLCCHAAHAALCAEEPQLEGFLGLSQDRGADEIEVGARTVPNTELKVKLDP